MRLYPGGEDESAASSRIEATLRIRKPLVVAVFAALVAALVIVMVPSAQAEPAAAFDYSLGVNPAELDDAQLVEVLNKAKSAGVTSIHTGGVWWYLETSPRSYDWSHIDSLVSGAEQRGMKVTLQLSGTPDWVHADLIDTVPSHSQRIWYPPRSDTELDHWSNFVHDVVSRYGGRVARYEMWNEPNVKDYWNPKPNVREYAALLRAGYLSAKSAYPDASVEFGGLSRNDVGFLDAYYEAAKGYPDAAANSHFFDVLNVHPFSSIPSDSGGLEEPILPDMITSDAVIDGAYGEVDQNFAGLRKMKAVMDAKGETGKPIRLGEYGFSTEDTWMKAVPDYRRALYLKRAYALARTLPYVEGMSWYAYFPTSTSGPQWSIVDANLNESMTFRALRQTTGSEPGIATVTLGSPNTCSISGTYSVGPTPTDLGPISRWEFYVDGAYQGTYGKVPFDWDTTSVADGEHTLMVAAYTQEGSVWPSDWVSVKVNNGEEPVTVDDLRTDASSYPAGSAVVAEATLCCRVPMDFERLKIQAKRKSTGEYYDFPMVNGYPLGTTAQTITSTRIFTKQGTYQYWLAYFNGGSWNPL